MNRMEAVVGIGVIAAIAVGMGQKYSELSKLAQAPDPAKPQRPPVAQVNPEGEAGGLESAARAFIANTDAASDTDRLVHLGELLAAIDGPTYDTQDLDEDMAEATAKAIVDALKNNPDDSKEGLELRRRAVGLLAGRIASPTSKAYVLQIMDEGPQELREEAIARVGSARGVRGPSVYAKVRALADKGLVPDELLPSALRRTGGLKAREALVTLMKSTDSAILVNGCAVAIQDYRDPALLGDVLERLEQVGRLDNTGRMPWISASLLDLHMKAADRSQFRRGIMAMAARPSLAKTSYLKAGLDSADVETRQIAAVAVKKAVIAKVIDAQTGEAMLAGRLQSETEPVLKAELTGGLERVRGLLPQKTGQQ
jgi:hypothetical protein